MKVIGLAGWSGAGKTTLLAAVIPLLTQQGLRVSTLKHAHHAFDIDHPGKDSYEHRAAGATEVMVVSGRRWALMHELRGEAEPGLAALLQRMSAVDLVIVEGFKREAHPRIEVHRGANGKPWLYPDLPGIAGLVSDAEPPGWNGARAHLDDHAAAAGLLTSLAAPLGEVLSCLGRPAECPSQNAQKAG